MGITKIGLAIKRFIEWQGSFFLREHNVTFFCDCNKKEFEKKLSHAFNENKRKNKLHVFRSNFVVRINGDRIAIKRKMNIWGMAVYQLVGHIIGENERAFIVGRYQMTPINRLFSLFWVNLFLLFFLIIFFSLLKDGFSSLFSGNFLDLIGNDVTIISFSLGAFLFGIVVLRVVSIIYSIKPLSSYLFKFGIKQYRMGR